MWSLLVLKGDFIISFSRTEKRKCCDLLCDTYEYGRREGIHNERMSMTLTHGSAVLSPPSSIDGCSGRIDILDGTEGAASCLVPTGMSEPSLTIHPHGWMVGQI